TLPKPASGRRDRLRERLCDLAAGSTVEEFDVSTWPKRVPRDGSCDPAVRDRYLEFAAWARDNGVRLSPFFGTRECYSMETGERGEWVVLPALCLAVYEDGDLSAVYPHADGDTYHSVLSGLRHLETAATEATESPAPSAAD
ncbi:hypothetical protein BRD17_00860, partial [Halobacteriales archaeon SW_7_68_16]